MNAKPDYRKLRFNNITSPQYSHLLYLLFWPIWGVIFALLEGRENIEYHVVECDLDAWIPFCEFFVIPYLFWFAFLAGMLLYGLFFDVETFRKMSQFIIITYMTTALIYVIWPSQQLLRPVSFDRQNLFTSIMGHFYAFDTNTNVCPSLHVIGSMAALFAGWHSRYFRKWSWRIPFIMITILICLSTVFLKQHSLLDIPPALVISFAAYLLVYKRRKKTQKQVQLEVRL